MKKSSSALLRLVSMCLIVFITGNSINAQIVVKESKSEEIYKSVGGQHKMYKMGLDSTSMQYVFYFRDAQYKQLIDYKYFSFKSLDEVKQFFELVIKAIDEKKEFELLVGKSAVAIHSSGTSAMIFLDGGYCMMNKKQAEILIQTVCG